MVAKATYRPVAKMHLPQTISSDFKKITYYEKSQGERLEVLVKQKSMLATKCTTCPILYQNRSNKTSPCLNKGVHFTSPLYICKGLNFHLQCRLKVWLLLIKRKANLCQFHFQFQNFSHLTSCFIFLPSQQYTNSRHVLQVSYQFLSTQAIQVSSLPVFMLGTGKDSTLEIFLFFFHVPIVFDIF